jgi:hypothetical protein
MRLLTIVTLYLIYRKNERPASRDGGLNPIIKQMAPFIALNSPRITNTKRGAIRGKVTLSTGSRRSNENFDH